MNLRRNLAVLAALVLALTACGKKEEASKTPTPPATTAPAPSAGVTVTAITLGTAVGPDKKVTRSTDTFGVKDTIYASVDTTGTGTATLRAKWTYRKNGQEAVVKEDTMTIAPTGAATNEFHISKPDGWPAGNYQVEIFVADKSAATKAFTVK
jgi:hypothetical protein